jgi:WD40 repeat protein
LAHLAFSVFITEDLSNMSTFSKKSKTNKFSFYGFCAGHLGPVECLAVVEDGSLLASGGKSSILRCPITAITSTAGADGTRVWNLDTTRELQRPGGAGSRGATSCVLWVRRRDEPDIVFYGTQNGYLVAWKRTNSSVSFPPLLVSWAELATDGRNVYRPTCYPGRSDWP